MTNALCANSVDLADLQVESLDAPGSTEVGEDVLHEFAVVNAGPAPASDVRVEAAHEGELGDPGVTCSADGVPSTDVGLAVCEWPGATDVDETRSMALSWTPDESTPAGATVTVDYQASSASVGTTASATATTTVQGSVATMEITSLDAPATVVAGTENVVHRLEARNAGPSTAPDMRITADVDGDLDDPAVACSEGGQAEGAGCVWPGDSPVDAERWAELEWAVPQGTPDGTLSAEYLATSAAPAADAAASAVTEIVTARADLELSVVDAPGDVEQGTELVHVVQAANTGPSAAESVRILADYGPELDAPSVTCSSGGAATTFTEIGRARCTWSGETPVGGERTMELHWAVDEETPAGTVVTVDHRATSDTPGVGPTASTSTAVVEAEEPAPTP